MGAGQVGRGAGLVEEVGQEWGMGLGGPTGFVGRGNVPSGVEPRGRAGVEPHLVHKALRVEQRVARAMVFHLQRVAVWKQKLRVG